MCYEKGRFEYGGNEKWKLYFKIDRNSTQKNVPLIGCASARFQMAGKILFWNEVHLTASKAVDSKDTASSSYKNTPDINGSDATVHE